MTDQTLVVLGLMCCGALTALILFRAASDVLARRDAGRDTHEEA